ncbi:CoA transferase [Variovorax sp. J22P168]|uniref:CaiB/BaiF CoA transferase family protein n=1 Tax=Variovorax jilinensis TaxID=3053513 RepID=UPI0025786554|nr:CoA transferase [Variovorax sp. J22P168]MDM0015159.1 CoA transferase [Variovorax sp. J22P168]
MTDTAPKPLSGLRVLDFSNMLAGPYCGRWLADLGADVIKIESPEGDPMRNRPPLRNEHSAYFGHVNCGKRSIVLDLKKPEAADIVRSLAAKSDVLLEGFRPGVMARFGLDHESLKEQCPSLIYCSISGYGQDGPLAESPAYAAIVHATSGFDEAWRASQPNQSQPPTCGVQIADVLAGSFATMAIQTALLARQGSGRGQHVDLSLMEGMLTLMPLEIVQAQFPEDARRAQYRPIKAADGYIIVTPITPKNFVDLCVGIGRPELRSDPRFADPLDRVVNWDILIGEVEAWSSLLSSVECLARLDKAGVPASRHATVADALGNRQLAQREFFGTARDGAGDYAIASLPFRLNGEPARPVIVPKVPRLGEHTREVLERLLGKDSSDVERLVAEGVAGTFDPVAVVA